MSSERSLHEVARKVATIAFAIQLALFDLIVRGYAPYERTPRLWSTAMASALVGWLACLATRRRTGIRIAVSSLWASLLVLDGLVFRHYHTMLDRYVVASAVHAFGDVKQVVWGMLPGTLCVVLAVAAVEYALLRAATNGPAIPRTWRSRSVVALVAVLCVLVGAPIDQGTPDLRVVDAALSLVVRERAVEGHTTTRLPVLPSSRATLPNVLFVLTESVRSLDYPPDGEARAHAAPRVAALLPDRVEFDRMHAVASYTAVSVSALLSGKVPAGTRDEILSAPVLFDFLKAARRGESAAGIEVAYWSAQSVKVFERREVGRAIDSFESMESLLGQEVNDEDELLHLGVDRTLADRVQANMSRLTAPYFLMLHFGGTHAPYFVDEADAPHVPWDRAVLWSKMAELRNAYRNAIFEQDKSIARAIQSFLDAQHGHPWVVVFTSDHGEAFGERGAIHHGQNLYPEQIHVPGFLAFGNDALSPDERTAVAARRHELSTHLDVLPTILDAYGLLDAAAPAGRFEGQSLLRGRALVPEDRRASPIVLTNCTAMFPCPVKTWGMLDEQRLVLAQPWDATFRCLDSRNGLELDSERDGACSTLTRASMDHFSELPNGAPNRPAMAAH